MRTILFLGAALAISGAVWWGLHSADEAAAGPRAAPAAPPLERRAVGLPAPEQREAPPQENGAARGEALRLNEQALALLAAGDEAGAEALWVQACGLDPADAVLARNLSRARVRLGRSAEGAGRDPAALEWYRAARIAHADDGGPAEWEIGLLLRNGAREAARAGLQRALADHPRAPGLLRLRGELAFLDGDLDLAVQSYEAVVGVDERPALRERLEQLREERRVYSHFLTDATAHCDSRFDPEDAVMVARMPQLRAELETAWQEVTQRLGVGLESRLLVLWLSPERYRGAAPDWSAGLYDGRVRVLVDAESGVDDTLRATLRHELTHAVLHAVGQPLPTWLHEGLAQRSEGRSVARARERLRQSGLTLDRAALEGSWTAWTDRALLEQAYDFALSQVNWLEEHFGANALPGLLHAVGARGFEAAWREVFARPYDEIEAEHRAALRGA